MPNKLKLAFVSNDPNTFFSLDMKEALAYRNENKLDKAVIAKTVEHLHVATLTEGYGISRKDPRTTILAIGSEDQCRKAYVQMVGNLSNSEDINPDFEKNKGSDNYWRGIDEGEDKVYIVEYYAP